MRHPKPPDRIEGAPPAQSNDSYERTGLAALYLPKEHSGPINFRLSGSKFVNRFLYALLQLLRVISSLDNGLIETKCHVL